MKQNISFQLLILFGVILLSSVFARPALSENNLFIKIGNLSGGSLDPQHIGWCDGVSFDQVISSQGKDECRGCFNDIQFDKEVDQTSPDLYIYATNGQVIPEVRFQFYTVDGESGSLVFEIVLTNCCVTSVLTCFWSSSETVKLSFAEIAWKFFPPSSSEIERSCVSVRCDPCSQVTCGPLTIKNSLTIE